MAWKDRKVMYRVVHVKESGEGIHPRYPHRLCEPGNASHGVNSSWNSRLYNAICACCEVPARLKDRKEKDLNENAGNTAAGKNASDVFRLVKIKQSSIASSISKR